MTATQRRFPLLAAVTAVVALVAGCTSRVSGSGTAPPHAGELVQAAYRTMTSLPGGFTVRQTLTIRDRTLTSEVRLQGDDAEGTITIADQRCELRRVDGRDYGRAPAAFWESLGVAASDAATVAGRWATFDDTIGLASQLTPKGYLVGYADASDDQYDGVRSGQVDGTRAWQTTRDQTASTLSITTGSPSRLLRVESQVTRLDFSFPTDDLQVSAPDGAVALPG